MVKEYYNTYLMAEAMIFTYSIGTHNETGDFIGEAPQVIPLAGRLQEPVYVSLGGGLTAQMRSNGDSVEIIASNGTRLEVGDGAMIPGGAYTIVIRRTQVTEL